jgi:acyl dehydratase
MTEQIIEWFEDAFLGMRFKSPEMTISADDIKRFAVEYDPQPMHLDEEAAKTTLFKGLIASGWQTAAISMKLVVQTRPLGSLPLIGTGVNDLRWMLPVRPGDTLHVEGEVIELNPSKTKPQGQVLIKWTTYNQHAQAVYTFTPFGGSVPRRPAAAVSP